MKDRTRFWVYGLCFVFFLNLIAGLVSSWIGDTPVSNVVAVVISTTVIVFLALVDYQRLRTVTDRERVFLKRVHDSWVASLNELERFAPGVSLIDLKYRRYRGSRGDEQLSIIRVFEKARRSLLILGKEGSGKTVSVMVLTKGLVRRALRDPSQPVPVVLTLASWNDKIYEDFQDWIVDELKLKYDLAETESLNWLIGRRLLLILDGLDEVIERRECVEKLQTFLNVFQPPGIVVSSRTADPKTPEENDGAPAFPDLIETIEIGDLSDNQIWLYSTQSRALFSNSTIPELARSPLNLTLMLLVARNTESRNDLLTTYIRRRLDLLKDMDLPYERHDMIRRIRWLAREMDEHRQAIFYLERLQPSWLPKRSLISILLPQHIQVLLTAERSLHAVTDNRSRWDAERPYKSITLPPFIWNFLLRRQWLPRPTSKARERWELGDVNQLGYALASRMLATFFVMMFGWLLITATERWLGAIKELSKNKISFGLNFVTGVPLDWLFITIVLGGLTMAIPDYLRFRKSERLKVASRVRTTLTEGIDFKNVIYNAGICWPVFFGSAWLFKKLWPLVFGDVPFLRSLFQFSYYKMFSGATVYAILFGLVFWFRGSRNLDGDIRTADKLNLKGLSLLKGFFPGLGAGGLIGLFPALLVGWRWGWIHGQTRWISAWQFWIICLILGLIVGGLTHGLDKVSVIEKTYPNQGVWLSLRNMTLIWLAVGGSSSLLIWIYAILITGSPSATIQDSLFLGSVIGMLVGFGYAGLDAVYHVALRIMLARKGLVFLWTYVGFLNNATHLGLLRRVGSGYVYLHGSLRKRFQDYEETENVRSAR